MLKKVFTTKTDKERILDTIEEQHVLRHKFNQYDANSPESQELIDINLEQLQDNIKDLSRTFCELLNPLKNKELNLKEYIELLKHKIPKDCKGFSVEIPSEYNRIDTRYNFTPKYTLYAQPNGHDTENYKNKLKVLNSNKLTKKFKDLYEKKLQEKIVDTLSDWDEQGWQFAESKNYNLETMIKLIAFHRDTISFETSWDLPFAVVKEEFFGLQQYLRNCSDLQAVFIFTKKQNLAEIIGGNNKWVM